MGMDGEDCERLGAVLWGYDVYKIFVVKLKL